MKLARLALLLLASPSVLAATEDASTKTFGAVTYHKSIFALPSDRQGIDIPSRSVQLTVEVGELSFVDYGRSFSIQFQATGCLSATDLAGYSDVSTANALERTIATEGLSLAKACRLRPADRIAWQHKVEGQPSNILDAVSYMQSRYAVW